MSTATTPPASRRELEARGMAIISGYVPQAEREALDRVAERRGVSRCQEIARAVTLLLIAEGELTAEGPGGLCDVQLPGHRSGTGQGHGTMTTRTLILTVDTGLATCGWALTDLATGWCSRWGETDSDGAAKFEARCQQHARAVIEEVEAALADTGARLHSVHLEVSGEGAPNSKRWGVLLVNAVTARLWHHLGEHWDWALPVCPIHERERGVRGLDEAGVVAEAARHLAEQGHDVSFFLRGRGEKARPIKARQHAADAVLLGRAAVRRIEQLELAKGAG